MTRLEIEAMLRDGGEWLGAVRNWLKWYTHNGDRVRWGSEEALSPPLTVRQVEEIALAAAVAAWQAGRKAGIEEAGRIARDCNAAAPSREWSACRRAIYKGIRRLLGNGDDRAE